MYIQVVSNSKHHQKHPQISLITFFIPLSWNQWNGNAWHKFSAGPGGAVAAAAGVVVAVGAVGTVGAVGVALFTEGLGLGSQISQYEKYQKWS